MNLQETFAEDGVVHIPQALNTHELQLARGAFEWSLANPGKGASRLIPGTPGSYYGDLANPYCFDAYTAVNTETKIPMLVARLWAKPNIWFMYEQIFKKTGGDDGKSARRTPWHQDQPYYNIDGSQNVSFWIPVDPVPRQWTIEFVAGSHLGSWLMPRTFLDEQARWFPEGAMDEVPDIEAQRGKYPILGWAVEPGDAVAFHMLTLHAAAGVQGNERRRVFSVRLMGDDVVHAPRAWETSPEFPGLKDDLAAGVAMNHPLFPLLLR